MWSSYAPTSFDHDGLFSAPYLLASEGRAQVYFAPFTTAPQPSARIVLVGITPGLAQVALAAEVFAETPPGDRRDDEQFASMLRPRVAFGGPMRSHLCTMLDAPAFLRFSACPIARRCSLRSAPTSQRRARCSIPS